MTRWATIDQDQLETEVEKIDAKIIALTGHHPTSQGYAKKKVPLDTAILLARYMGTRDALVTIHNCIARDPA